MILAGVGVAALWRSSISDPARLVTMTLTGGVLAHLAWQAWRASYEFAAGRRNPYAYAQTTPDALRLVDRVKALARIHPEGAAMPVKFIMPVSEWPLPWYLRSLQKTGWWAQPPEDVFAPVVIADVNSHLALDEKSERRWLMAGLFELRPGLFLELYVETELWKRLVEPPVARQ